MNPNSFLKQEEPNNVAIELTGYQLLTSSVNFLVTSTKLDLVFLYAMLSTFNAKPTI